MSEPIAQAESVQNPACSDLLQDYERVMRDQFAVRERRLEELVAGFDDFTGRNAQLRHDSNYQQMLGALGLLIISHCCSGLEITDAARILINRILKLPEVQDYLFTTYLIPDDFRDRLSNLEFYKLGTTSWICVSNVPATLQGEKLAFKFIKPFYFNVTTLTRETDAYGVKIANLFSKKDISSMTAMVKATSPHIIIMDFLEGPTLAEFIAEHHHLIRTGQDREGCRYAFLKQLSAYFSNIVEALTQCAVGHRNHHLDLNPNNIVLVLDRAYLIDFGVNNVTLLKLGTGSGTDAVEFVAPEVQASGYGDDRSDWYSVGKMLLHALDYHDESGDDNDKLFRLRQSYSGIGDLIDSLLLVNPADRLWQLDVSPGATSTQVGHNYRQLGQAIENELTIVSEAAHKALTALGVVSGLSGDHLFEAMSRREHQGEGFVSKLLAYVPYLALGSVIVWAMQLGLAAFKAARIGGTVETIMGNYSSQTVSYALWAGVTFGVIGALYYSNVLLGVPRRGLPWWLSALIVTNSFFFAIPIWIAFLWPDLWALCSAIGSLWVFATNLALFTLTRNAVQNYAAALEQGRKPKVLVDGLNSFAVWPLGMLLYGVVLLLIWIGTHFGTVGPWGRLHDESFYVAGLVSMNIWLFWYNCIVEAPRVRAVILAGLYRYRFLKLRPAFRSA